MAHIAEALQWLLLFNVTMQFICFLIASYFKTEIFFDLMGTITFFLIATFSLVLGGKLHQRQVIVTTLVSIWSVRLGTFLLLRILRVGKDSRFDNLRDSICGMLFAWTLQAVWVYLVSVPVMLANLSLVNPKWGNALDIAGVIVWGVGFFVEAVADYQKHIFRLDDANEGKWIQTGLWKYSRHPNYCGEIILWCGIFLVTSSSLQGWELLAGLISPSFVVLLLVYGSGIPPLERAADKKWKNDQKYLLYQRNTPILFPWPSWKVHSA